MPEVLRPRRVPLGFEADPERTSCKANGGLDSPVPATEIALQQIPTEIATAPLRLSCAQTSCTPSVPDRPDVAERPVNITCRGKRLRVVARKSSSKQALGAIEQ